MKVLILIDYDNLLDRHKSSGILEVIRIVLFQTTIFKDFERGSCDVRIYGGWYEDSLMTRNAQDLSIAINADFPSIIRVPRREPNGIAAFRVSAELALSLLEEPSHHLFGTYRKKGKPSNIRIQSPEAIGCLSTICPLPHLKKIIKSGRCPNDTCVTVTEDLIYRHEQKIVDTMLTCDILFASSLDYEHIIIISGDDDFIPPIRTIILRGGAITRFNPKQNSTKIPLIVRGNQLNDLTL